MSQGVEAVDRALRIMGSFTSADPILSLREISARTSLNKATILRIIASLEKYNYISRLGEGRYSLGPSHLFLGSIYQRSLKMSDVILPILMQIMQRTGETASFFIRNKEQRVCLLMVESQNTLRSHLREGDVMPLRPSGTGKVLEAFDTPALDEAEHREARERGYAINLGERHSEIASVAVPVFRSGRKLAGAISVSGPIAHFTEERIGALVEILMEAASRASFQLGGSELSGAAKQFELPVA